MPRNQSSRRPYAETSHATYDNYQELPRRLPQHEKYKVTVTRYRIHTSGEFTTSYHDRREYSAYGSHRFSSGYRDVSDEGYEDLIQRPGIDLQVREANYRQLNAEYRYSDNSEGEPNRTSTQRDDRHCQLDQPGQPDRHYSSKDDAVPKNCILRRLRSSVEERQEYPSYANASHSHPEDREPAPRGGYAGISKSHGSHKHRRHDNYSQEKPTGGRGRREETHFDSRSNTRREEDSRSNMIHPYSREREQQYYRRGFKPSQPEEPKPTSRDGHPSKSKSYSNHKHTTNEKPSKDKPASSSSRRQETPYSSKSDSRHRGNPGRNGKDSSHETKVKENLPDYYAILNIDHVATEKKIKSAAKRRRAEVHPDKLKRAGMSDSECAKIDALAAKVGEAADILLDSAQRMKYDREWCAAIAN